MESDGSVTYVGIRAQIRARRDVERWNLTLVLCVIEPEACFMCIHENGCVKYFCDGVFLHKFSHEPCFEGRENECGRCIRKDTNANIVVN
jgi:hypothetical protein